MSTEALPSIPTTIDVIKTAPHGLVLSSHTLYDKLSGEAVRTPERTTSAAAALARCAVRACIEKPEGLAYRSESFGGVTDRHESAMERVRQRIRRRLKREASTDAYIPTTIEHDGIGPDELVYELPPEYREEAASMYSELTDLLQNYLEDTSAIALGDTDRLTKHKGNIGELAMLALLYRGVRGDANDRYLAVPATASQDKGTTTHEGLRTGYDMKVIRNDGLVAKVQVKFGSLYTQRFSEKSDYAPDILCVSLVDIANGPKHAEHLIDAMIQEVQNIPGIHHNQPLIDSAYASLTQAIDTHLEALHP